MTPKIQAFDTKTNIETIYRFKTTLYSVGSGIDGKAKIEIEKFINTESNKNIKVFKRSWGREGEIDYCFDLSILSSEEQTAFIQNFKTTLINFKRLNYNENCLCK